MTGRRAAQCALVVAVLGVPPVAGWAQAPQPRLEVRPVGVLYGYLLEGPFQQPAGVFFDRHHRELYVCDAAARRILIADESLFPIFSFGNEELLGSPRGVAVDREGRMYVADSGQPTLRVFDYDGTPLPPFDLAAPEGDKPPRPGSVVLSPEGDRLYVLDVANDRVLVLSVGGELQRVISAPRGRGDLLRSPVDLDLTPRGELVVTDSAGLAVQLYDTSGRFVRGWGSHDVGIANFSLPAGVAVDTQGRIYVADTLRHDVKVFAPDGTFLAHFGGWGDGPGQLRYPVDVATDGAFRIFVSERVNLRVQAFEVRELGPR